MTFFDAPLKLNITVKSIPYRICDKNNFKKKTTSSVLTKEIYFLSRLAVNAKREYVLKGMVHSHTYVQIPWTRKHYPVYSFANNLDKNEQFVFK